MIVRRHVLSGGTALAVVTAVQARAATVPPDRHFEVFRNDSRIGHHTVGFRAEGDTLVATVGVEIAVRLGPIPLFRYTHSVRETWRGDQFLSLESDTNDDGKHFHVQASNAGNQVVIVTEAAPRTVFPPDTIPLTHWNILCMRRKLFNPQDGVPIDSTVVSRGETMVPLADGQQVRASHFSLVGKVALDDWYDTAQYWTALHSTGTDGSRIEYRLAA
jgi:hypothetical protein